MKKVFILILTVLFCLCGCGGNGENSSDGSKIPAGVVGKDLNGEVCIKERNAGKIMESVELTAENWQDYLEVFSYEKVQIERDSFGEIISEYRDTVYLLGAKTDRYHGFSSPTAIELFHKETGERKVLEFYHEGAYVDAEFDLNDYEFSRITGTIFFIDIPEEVVIRTQWGDDHGEATFKIGDSSHARTFYIMTPTKSIRSWFNDFEQYMD